MCNIIKKIKLSIIGLFCLYALTNVFAFDARFVFPKTKNALYESMGKVEYLKIRVHSPLLSDSRNIRVKIIKDGTTIKTLDFSDISDWAILKVPVDDITFENTRSTPYSTKDNPYIVKIELMQGESVRESESLDLYKYPPAPSGVNEVYLDEGNNPIIDGTPTFILGTYADTKGQDVADNIKDNCGMNCIQTNVSVSGIYRSSSSTAWEMYTNGVDAALNSARKDREKPEVIGYYVADEPIVFDRRTPDEYRELQTAISSIDPYHVTCITNLSLYNPTHTAPIDGWQYYYETADMWGPDCYACVTASGGFIGGVTDNYKRQFDPNETHFWFLDCPIFGVPQLTGQEEFETRMPRDNESYNMIFQHIACGGKYLMGWAYAEYDKNPEMYKYWKTIRADIDKCGEAIIGSKFKCGKVFPEYAFPRTDISVTSSDADNLTWCYSQSYQKEYLYLVNTTNKWDTRSLKNKAISVTVTFKNSSGNSSIKSLLHDSDVSSSFNLVNGKMTVTLSGVDENHKGVLILSRDNTSVVPELTTKEIVARNTGICFKTYPNPAKGNTFINLYSFTKKPGNASLKIYDVSGKLVWKKKLENNQRLINWNTSNYSSGNYIINLQVGDNMYKKNVCIKK